MFVKRVSIVVLDIWVMAVQRTKLRSLKEKKTKCRKGMMILNVLKIASDKEIEQRRQRVLYKSQVLHI